MPPHPDPLPYRLNALAWRVLERVSPLVRSPVQVVIRDDVTALALTVRPLDADPVDLTRLPSELAGLILGPAERAIVRTLGGGACLNARQLAKMLGRLSPSNEAPTDLRERIRGLEDRGILTREDERGGWRLSTEFQPLLEKHFPEMLADTN